jgi:hypothetical protein
MVIQQFCRTIDTQLAGLDSQEDKLASAAKALSQIFGVRRDEVAIFLFDPRFDVLRFSWPLQLRAAGVVPLTAQDALVSQTVRERKSYMDNRFALTPHLHIFETFQLELTGGIPIQKILSAPMLRESEPRGAVQVSRKGETFSDAGRDFIHSELEALSRIATVMAQHL